MTRGNCESFTIRTFNSEGFAPGSSDGSADFFLSTEGCGFFGGRVGGFVHHLAFLGRGRVARGGLSPLLSHSVGKVESNCNAFLIKSPLAGFLRVRCYSADDFPNGAC